MFSKSMAKWNKTPQNSQDNVCLLAVLVLGSSLLLISLLFCHLIYTKHEIQQVTLEGVLAADRKPLAGETIFFHKRDNLAAQHMLYFALFEFFTREVTQFYTAKLTLEEACAIESAAISNPHLDVFVLFAQPVFFIANRTDRIMRALLTYPNIHMRHLDLKSYITETPLESWLHEKYSFRIIERHALEILPYLTLWRWGGISLNLDTIVLRSLESLPANFVVAKPNTNGFDVSILGFSLMDPGHSVVKNCLTSMREVVIVQKISRDISGDALIHALGQSCNVSDVLKLMKRKQCQGVETYGSEFFFEVPFNTGTENCYEEILNKTTRHKKTSYAIHKWRDFLRIKDGSIAAKICPRVYEIPDKFRNHI